MPSGVATPAMSPTGRPWCGAAPIGRARLVVEYSTTASFADTRRIVGPRGSRGHRLHGARRPDRPAAGAAHLVSRAVSGSLRPAPLQRTRSRAAFKRRSRRGVAAGVAPAGDVSFTFSGDCVGQGWGIDERARRPAALRGDAHAAAGPVHPPRRHHLRRPAAHVRGRPRRRLDLAQPRRRRRSRSRRRRSTTSGAATATTCRDEHMRRFNAEVSQIALWDDHEVRDNWYPTERLDADPRAGVKRRRARWRAGEASVPRVPAAAHQPDRNRADLPGLAPRPGARDVRARHADRAAARTRPTARPR